MSALHGVWPACPTILTDDEELDEEGMRALVRFLVAGGVDGLWLLGGGGEGVVLSEPVRRRAVEVALEEAGEVPILAGISAEGTRRALTRYEAIADLAVAGVFATAPYYFVTDEQETLDFYGALARETGRPIVVYNNPYVAKAGIRASSAARLAEIEGIVGIKDSSGDFLTTQSIIRAVRDVPGFAVATGYDQLMAASLLAGADGVVTAVGCFVPDLVVKLVQAARSDDAARAVALQHEVLDLLDRLAWDPYSDSAFIRGVKTCLEVLGVCRAPVSRPFTGASDEERRHVAAALEPLVGVTQAG